MLKPDVLLLDRGLPGVEGLDVLTRLRSRGVLAPALVLSALGNPADRVEGLDRGAEDYLAKPFDVDELPAVDGDRPEDGDGPAHDDASGQEPDPQHDTERDAPTT